MTLSVTIHNRDFTNQPIKPVNFKVNQLAWTAYGGPDSATITAHAPYERLLDFVSLLRCALKVSDHTAEPVWWGYINKIEVQFNHVNFHITLDDLFNKVKVIYSYLSPDNIEAELYETAFAGSDISQEEYGTKERVLLREGVDDDFALALRDTFLEVSSFPRSQLSPSALVEVPTVTLHAKGWFHTLGWRFYEELDGYYANHGPGPGQTAFGDGTISGVGQSFIPTKDVTVQYVYFMLRKQGSPSSNLFVRLVNHFSTYPGPTIYATSNNVAGAGFSSTQYQWFKFEFPTPYILTSGTTYWVYIVPNTTSSSNYYLIKHDENMLFNQGLIAKRYYLSTSSWINLWAFVMSPSTPHLYFRVVCTDDSGTILKEMAEATGQFFTAVETLTSGVVACPYRADGLTTLEEITTLMKLGTVNQREILAKVSVDRRLTFYEAPDRIKPTAYLDPAGNFYTAGRQLLPRWRPPVGQYAMLSGVDRFTQPFDLKRSPAYFVGRYVYTSA